MVTLPIKRSRKQQSKHWHFDDRTMSLWCAGCSEIGPCGALSVKRALGNCLDYCCKTPEKCTRPCPNNPSMFADRLAEIGGNFDLDDIPRGPVLPARVLPDEAPIFYHDGKVQLVRSLPAACIPIYKLIVPSEGRTRFNSGDEMRRAFGLSPETAVIATGVGQDKSVEAWWGMGQPARRRVIPALVDQGVGFVTTPNFSLAADEPRWCDLHAIKRAGIAHTEFLEGGMPAAYHVNARTEKDYERIAKFISGRSEITHIAMEFLTGAGVVGRADWSFQQIEGLVSYVGRKLHLTFRGRLEHMKHMAKLFPNMTVLDADAFMKTVHFKRLVPQGNARLRPKSAPNANKGELFEDNWKARSALIRGMRFAA